MTNLKAKLDAIEKKQRLKLCLSFISILVTVIIAWSLFFFPPMGGKSEISGEVIRLFGKPTMYGDKLYLIVRLEDSQLVRSYVLNSAYYKKGATVKLLKMEPLVCCKIVYKFRGYE